jgi:hypothetical protein
LIQTPIEGVSRVPYRLVVVVDISGRRVERMSDRSQCRRELPTLTANPNPVLDTSAG